MRYYLIMWSKIGMIILNYLRYKTITFCYRDLRQKKEAYNFRCKPSLRLGTFVKVDYNIFVELD